MNKCFALAAAVLLTAGCTSQPKLLRHYQILQTPAMAPASVELSVFLANPKASGDSPLVSGLSERGQAELIRSLASKVSKEGGAAELMGFLHEPTEIPPKACAWANTTSMSKRLILTVLGNLSKPADRIEKLDILLTLPNPPKSNGTLGTPKAIFTSWDRFDSVYGTFNIGSAKFTQSNKLSLGRTTTGTSNLANSAGSIVKVFDLGYEADNTLEESAAYALRRLYVGGALTDTTARLVQEGAPNINLFGSSAATISFKLLTDGDVHPVYNFTLQKNNKAVDAADVKIEWCSDKYPRNSSAIQAAVSGTALLREVSSGDGTVTEGDDEVRFRFVSLTPSTVTLAGPPDLEVQRFGLAQCAAGSDLDDCSRLHIEHSGAQMGSVEQILVPSMGAAIALRAWLVDQSKVKPVKAIGGFSIGMAPRITAQPTTVAQLTGLTATDVGRLRVVRLLDNN